MRLGFARSYSSVPIAGARYCPKTNFFHFRQAESSASLRTGFAKPHKDLSGNAQVFAPFPKIELQRCLARASQPRGAERSGSSHAGIFHLSARARVEYAGLYQTRQVIAGNFFYSNSKQTARHPTKRWVSTCAKTGFETISI